MKKFFCFIWFAGLTLSIDAQGVLSLDSCRALAIANNKELLISQEKIKSAHYQKKAAFTNYLPNIEATGAYLHTQKALSLLSDSQKEALGSMGTHVSGAMQNGIEGMLIKHPELTQNPDFMNFISAMSGIDVETPLNNAGNALSNGLSKNIRNIYVGKVGITQPVYMGGKIRAYNKITKYAEELAHQQHDGELQDVILSTDQAYWQVVSLAGKKKLAEGYLELLQKLDSDIDKMIAEGVATKADGLSVKVKVNEAEMTLTKVDDGLNLSRMLLCQLCGIDLSTPIILKDEQEEDLQPTLAATDNIDMNTVYETRPELRSLSLATEIYKQKVHVERAEHLPTVALMGNYLATNPSAFNGIEKKFKGKWSVGVIMKVPIWHWGEGNYKVKAAKAEARIAQFQLDNVREKVELQVNQSVFKVNEAAKKLTMTEKNMEKAEENLRYATLGFEEGIIPTSNVLEAHTAWLSAHSEKIDAQIDVKLTEVYLMKSLGKLNR